MHNFQIGRYVRATHYYATLSRVFISKASDEGGRSIESAPFYVNCKEGSQHSRLIFRASIVCYGLLSERGWISKGKAFILRETFSFRPRADRHYKNAEVLCRALRSSPRAGSRASQSVPFSGIRKGGGPPAFAEDTRHGRSCGRTSISPGSSAASEL